MRITRNELYQLVWSEPLRTLAKRFSISDVALAKRCRSANIPVPGLGYWAKKEAGKPVPQPPLPARGLGQADLLEIGPSKRLSYAEEEQQLLAETPSPPPRLVGDLPEVMNRARKAIGKVSASTSLWKPHPVVAKLLAQDEKRKDKLLQPHAFAWDGPIFESPFEKRRLRFLNALILALARADVHASIKGREGYEVSLRVGDQYLNFSLCALNKPRDSYPRPSLPATERMKLELGWYQPPPEVTTAWIDEQERSLEEQLDEIAVSLLAYGEWAYRWSLQRQYEYRVERKQELEERVRKEREEAERKERERVEREAAAKRTQLVEDVKAWRTAREIRTYVEAQIARWSGASNSDQLSALQVWAEWARSQADELDPLHLRPKRGT